MGIGFDFASEGGFLRVVGAEGAEIAVRILAGFGDFSGNYWPAANGDFVDFWSLQCFADFKPFFALGDVATIGQPENFEFATSSGRWFIDFNWVGDFTMAFVKDFASWVDFGSGNDSFDSDY